MKRTVYLSVEVEWTDGVHIMAAFEKALDTGVFQVELHERGVEVSQIGVDRFGDFDE